MPVFRAYPQASSINSTDAFLIDRIGAGTLFVEPAVFSTLFSFLVNTPSYPNDVSASAAGVAVGQVYRNGSVIQIRVT